jgi:hypothetical protein
MSYKLNVVKDNPLAFWLLDDLSIRPLLDYQGILNEFNTYLELKQAYTTYGNINYITHDVVGFNDGNYDGDFEYEPHTFPLVSGGIYPVNIYENRKFYFDRLKSFDGIELDACFGTIYNQFSPFTIEGWVLPNILSEEITTIFADPINSVGIFWQKNKIIFKLSLNSISYYLPYSDKSNYIVCSFDGKKAKIYIDAKLVIEKEIPINTFDNNDLILQCGPVNNEIDSFIVDNFAIYTYALSQLQITNHFEDYGYKIPIQVVSPDNGELFEFYDNKINTVFEYSYPYNKSWESFLTEDIYYNRIENYISLNQTSDLQTKEVIIEDSIVLPSGTNMDSSKIEWYGINGISIQSSIDGINYLNCENGQSIPQYKIDDFSEDRVLYLKIIINSEDTSQDLPILSNLSVSFFNNKILYSKNGSSYLSKIENLDWFLGKENLPILSHDKKNGLLVPENSGFKINTEYLTSSIEFFYTGNITTSGKLIFTEEDGDGYASNYSWDASGTISKNNIQSIYVNGVDHTSATNISDLIPNNLTKHIVIVFTNPVYGSLIFNYNSLGNDSGLYQYLSLYRIKFDYNKIKNHYDLYIGNYENIIHDSRISISENSISHYNNDWIVIQNV